MQNGPVPKGTRLRVAIFTPGFSIAASDDGWVAEGLTDRSFQLESLRNHLHGLSVNTPSRVFDRAGRLVVVKSARSFLRVLRQNPSLRLSGVTPVRIGGIPGLRARVETDPKPPFPPTCQGSPCTLIFPLNGATFVLYPGVEELTFVKRGPTLFFVDATIGDPPDPALERRVHALVDSIRFER
jgi:hypothetical protein